MPELTPQDFVAKWKHVTAREKQTYQEHFLDLCHLLHEQTPNEADPTGTQYAFEMGAAKTTGGQGWADVAKLHYFGWEYKSKDADLNKAYEQLLRYRDSLQNPPLLIVSDINNIIIRTNYTDLPTRVYTITLDGLLDPQCLDTLKAVFTQPDKLKPQKTVEKVTEEAAAHFARLAANLRKYGYQPQEIAHFLIRLLFCLFAEDIGLLPETLLPRLLQQTRRNAADFSEVLRQLFRAMKAGGYFGDTKILHFNGGLFDDDSVLKMDWDDMQILAEIDALDWAAIQPSIFGTLFERGLDPARRSQLGAHYTGEDDMRLIVEPVLMQPLRRKWDQLKADLRSLKAEEAQEKRGRRKTLLQKDLRDGLFKFAGEIDSIKVLDPACGSGNFLYVALRLLLDLQKEVFAFADELGIGRPFVTVTPSQLYGIELNEYAHELAQVTIQIGYIQWLRENGYGRPNEPILQRTNNILHMDAILAYDKHGNPIEPEWPPVDVIVSNPPFLGVRKMREQLGDKYTEDLRALYQGRLPGHSDIVCYWFEKARAMLDRRAVKRVGLLATQGIRGGTNRRVLDRISTSASIFWAQSDRDWVLDGAAVHVSMIAFDNGEELGRSLDSKPVKVINPDLTATSDLTNAKALAENADLSFQGTAQVGPFEITKAVAATMLAATGNPNNRPNSDVVKTSINGLDIVRAPRGMWTVDFGADMPLEEASKYEMPFEYLRTKVKPMRDKSRSQGPAAKWWLYVRPRPAMRRALGPLSRYIVTPWVSKHRLFVWVPAGTIPSLVVVITRDDDYFLGVLQSRIHVGWAQATGTQLREAESGRRYTPGTTFETFPFPWPPGKEPTDDPRVKAIARAAKELVEQRDRWLTAERLTAAEKKKRTLTNLYNARPTWLDLAHQRLDAAVFAAYGWDPAITDEQLLENLLALNLQRAATQQSPAKEG